jgi:hypothetical protein
VFGTWIIAGRQTREQGPKAVFLIEVCDFALSETDHDVSASQDASPAAIDSLNGTQWMASNINENKH